MTGCEEGRYSKVPQLIMRDPSGYCRLMRKRMLNGVDEWDVKKKIAQFLGNI